VSLPANQERELTVIEGALEARDPKLASMFSIFTRLARGDEVPRHERLARRVQPLRPLMATPADSRGWTRPLLVLPIAVLASIAGIAMTSTSAQHCPPHARHHAAGRASRACQAPNIIPGK
jgi:hypothetical protein